MQAFLLGSGGDKMLTATAVVGATAAAAATGTSIGTIVGIVGAIFGSIGTTVGAVFTVRAAVKSNSFKKEIDKLSKANKEQKEINCELKDNINKLTKSNINQERKIDELQRLNNNYEARFRELESSSKNYNRRIDKLDNSSELTTQILVQHNNFFNRKTYEPNESEMFRYGKSRRRSNAIMKKFGMPKLEKKDFDRNCESEYL